MEDLEQAIEGVLSNPEMMEKIMGMAQALGSGGTPQAPEDQNAPPLPTDMDLSGLSRLTGLLGKANIDTDQKNLLNALTPYLSSAGISRLRRAMQAARLAELANSMLGKGSEL